MLLDYAGTLRAGKSLVPDFRLRAMEDQRFAMQQEAMDFRREEMQRAREAAEQGARQEAEFRATLEGVMARGGRADDITNLLLRFPQMADAYKPALERMDEEQKQADITSSGMIYARLNNGDHMGAAEILRERVEAEREAGMEDPQDVALLAALESGEETELAVAKSMIGLHLAGLTGVEEFKSVYGGSEATTAVQREYDWRTERFGKAAADKWLATEDLTLVPVEKGGSVFSKSDFVTGGGEPSTNQEGGDPSVAGGMPQSGPIGSWIEETAGLSASSRKRATGVPGTYHADDNARDFPTATIEENVREGRRLTRLFGPQFDVIYSENDKSGKHNDHVHVEPGPQLGARIRGQGQPVRVRSVQEARKLPKGTEFITPDGRRMRR